MLHNIFDAADTPQTAYSLMRTNWATLRRDAAHRDSVQNTNSFSSSLTTNFLILGATTTAPARFAALPMFARIVPPDGEKPLAAGEFKLTQTAQTGATVVTGGVGNTPATYEAGGDIINPVSCTVNQYTQPFAITNTDLNSGIRLADLVTANMANLGTKIAKVYCAYITAANYSTLAPIIATAGAFGYSIIQQAWGALKKANRKNLMLDGPYFAKLINQPTLFQAVPVVPGAGWKNIIGLDYLALRTEWSAAGANIYGFACDPQAMGIICGYPLLDSPAIPGGILAEARGVITDLNIPLSAYNWFNTSTRTYWGSFDTMFGANVLDSTVGLVLASSTPT